MTRQRVDAGAERYARTADGRVSILRAGAVTALTLIAGCDANDKRIAWTESTRLNDGTILQTRWQAELKGPREFFTQSTAGVSWYAIEFSHPADGSPVRWESHIIDWSRPPVEALIQATNPVPSLEPQAVLADKGRLFMVARPKEHYRALGCPDPPYLLYRWDRGSWQREPLESIPLRRFDTNVQRIEGKQLQEARRTRHIDRETAEFRAEIYRRTIDLSGMTKQLFGTPAACAEKLDRRWTASERLTN